MSDQVGNPEDRFSHNEALMSRVWTCPGFTKTTFTLDLAILDDLLACIEPPVLDFSSMALNEDHQFELLWRNDKNNPLIITKYAPL